MDTDTSSETESEEIDELIKELNEFELKRTWGDEDIQVFESLEEGDAIKGVGGESVHYWSAVGSFGKEMEEEKLLYDLRDFTNGADFGIFPPEDVLEEFAEIDEGYWPAKLCIEGEPGRYLAKAWRPEGLKMVLESKRFDELYEHIDDRIFDDGRMLAVPSREYDDRNWSSRRTILVGSDQAIMTPRKQGEIHSGMGSEVREGMETGMEYEGIRETMLEKDRILVDGAVVEAAEDEGIMMVEVYPWSDYDIVRIEEEEGSVNFIDENGENIRTYEGSLKSSKGTYGVKENPRNFYLVVEDQE